MWGKYENAWREWKIDSDCMCHSRNITLHPTQIDWAKPITEHPWTDCPDWATGRFVDEESRGWWTNGRKTEAIHWDRFQPAAYQSRPVRTIVDHILLPRRSGDGILCPTPDGKWRCVSGPGHLREIKEALDGLFD